MLAKFSLKVCHAVPKFWEHLRNNYSMKNIYKIFLLFVSVFLLDGCSSCRKKIQFFEGIDLITHIPEKHKFCKKDSDIAKYLDSDNYEIDKRIDLRTEVKFKDKNKKNYNFDVSYSNQTIFEYEQFNSDTVYLKKYGIMKQESFYCVDSTSKLISYTHQKKIKNGYLNFNCQTNDSIDLNFLRQKFNEIEFIEK